MMPALNNPSSHQTVKLPGVLFLIDFRTEIAYISLSILTHLRLRCLVPSGLVPF